MSDTESSERPIREGLRRTSIAVQAVPQRKRSHDNMVATENEAATKARHGRKRSREIAQEDVEQERERSKDSVAAPLDNGTDETAPPATAERADTPDAGKPEDKESPKTKRNKVDDAVASHPKPPSDEQEPPAKTIKIPAGSGFANTSAASPFAALAQTKPSTEQPQTSSASQTSSTAFAASGFGALAGSSASGFGALAPSKPLSSFASPSPTSTPAPTDENAKPEAKSAFGSTSLGASPFSTASSAFGTLGNGFGNGGGFGGLGGSKLSGFASSGTSGVVGSSKTSIKPFGAPNEEEEEKPGVEEGGEELAAKSPKPDEEEKKDERFFEQEIETGEENESTEYTCRAKLYNFVDKKEWKERGLGVLRLNVLNPKPGDDSTTPKARLVMRADGSHRVILNTSIQKDITFGTVTGEPPVGGYLYFMGSMDGSAKLELLQLKIRQQFALELYDHIADLQKQM